MNTVVCIRFGLGGHTEYFNNPHSYLLGYNVPENWEADTDYEYPDLTPVIDGREFFRTEAGIEWAISGPMCGPEDDPINDKWPKPFKTYSVQNYIKMLKEFDKQNLVKFGHIENLKIVWD